MVVAGGARLDLRGLPHLQPLPRLPRRPGKEEEEEEDSNRNNNDNDLIIYNNKSAYGACHTFNPCHGFPVGQARRRTMIIIIIIIIIMIIIYV